MNYKILKKIYCYYIPNKKKNVRKTSVLYKIGVNVHSQSRVHQPRR